MLSQGILQSDSCYRLPSDTSVFQIDSNLPVAWQQCLTGMGELDLSQARLLTDSQYLQAVPAAPSARSLNPLHWLRRRNLPATPVGESPAALRDYPIRGTFYRLDEPIVDIASVVKILVEPHWEAVVLNQGPAVSASDGSIALRDSVHESIIVKPRRTVFTAGIGNIIMNWTPMQVRPLHVVMARSKTPLPKLYLHCLDPDGSSRLTITSHYDKDGAVVWYLGGRFTETGVRNRSKEQLRLARRHLAELLPGLPLASLEFDNIRVRRVQTRQRDGKLPTTPSIYQTGNVIAAWPNRLAAVPALAEAVMQSLRQDDILPAGADLESLTDWPRPAIAPYPWDEANRRWR